MLHPEKTMPARTQVLYSHQSLHMQPMVLSKYLARVRCFGEVECAVHCCSRCASLDHAEDVPTRTRFCARNIQCIGAIGIALCRHQADERSGNIGHAKLCSRPGNWSTNSVDDPSPDSRQLVGSTVFNFIRRFVAVSNDDGYSYG